MSAHANRISPLRNRANVISPCECGTIASPILYRGGGRLPAEPVEHPLVIIHPRSGRKLLYVNENFTEEIVGLPAQESSDTHRKRIGWLDLLIMIQQMHMKIPHNTGPFAFVDYAYPPRLGYRFEKRKVSPSGECSNGAPALRHCHRYDCQGR